MVLILSLSATPPCARLRGLADFAWARRQPGLADFAWACRQPGLAGRIPYSSLLLLSTVTAAMSSAIPTTIEIHGERVKPEMR